MWEGIVEFVAVIESKSFTLAAQQLGISTAKVSRQVTALEARLSTKLLSRTTRVVTPTELGQQFYHRCRHILDQLDDAHVLLNEQLDTPSGSLTITAPVTYGETVVAPLINDFILLYPRLNVTLNLNNQVLDLVQENYDLAIRLGYLENSSLKARRLGSRTLYTCASPHYLAEHGMPTTVTQLKQHQCIAGTASHWQFNINGRHVSHRVQPRLKCNSGVAVRDAARKGLGIIQLPDYYVSEDINTGALQAILPHNQVDDDGIWAVYPHTRHVPAKVRLLVDFLVDAFTASTNHLA